MESVERREVPEAAAHPTAIMIEPQDQGEVAEKAEVEEDPIKNLHFLLC